MPLMHGVHTSTLRKEMFLVIVQKQLQYVTGHAYFWAVSSKTSDRAGDWAGSPESTHQRPVYQSPYYGPLLCGISVPINGLNEVRSEGQRGGTG